MKKYLTSAAAVIAVTGMTVVVTPASARSQYDRGYRSSGHGSGGAVIAGIAGLAIGAAIAGGGRTRHYGGRPYGGGGYYGQPQGYYGGSGYGGYYGAPQAYYGGPGQYGGYNSNYGYNRGYGYSNRGYNDHAVRDSRRERRHERRDRRDERRNHRGYGY